MATTTGVPSKRADRNVFGHKAQSAEWRSTTMSAQTTPGANHLATWTASHVPLHAVAATFVTSSRMGVGLANVGQVLGLTAALC